ncbi:MAG: carboxymuconolactone decarboxylase family protein [Pseudomonadota bacterium]|mgnify:FL=1
MATLPHISDAEASAEVLAVFDDIRAVRGTNVVHKCWRALSHDPDLPSANPGRLKEVLGPGNLNPLVKEMPYIAVSVANGCGCCIHFHTAAAKAKGITPQQHGELVSVVGIAKQTNGLVTAKQLPLEEVFEA